RDGRRHWPRRQPGLLWPDRSVHCYHRRSKDDLGLRLVDLPQSLHIFRIPAGTIIERPVSALLIQSNASRDMRSDLVALLPRLRRFALTLAADVHGADALVRDVCGWAIANARLRGSDLGLDAWRCAPARRMAPGRARREPARPTPSPAPAKAPGEACEEQALAAGMTPGLAGAA